MWEGWEGVEWAMGGGRGGGRGVRGALRHTATTAVRVPLIKHLLHAVPGWALA